FASHPEFRALRDKLRETPGIEFTHDHHVREVKKKLERTQPGASDEMTCAECHQLEPRTRDFVPITFEAHCAPCHHAHLPMEPLAGLDLPALEQRRQALDLEFQRLDARIKAQESAGAQPTVPVARAPELAAVAAVAGDEDLKAELDRLRGEPQAVGAAPMSAA